jgi:hypothetical protein
MIYGILSFVLKRLPILLLLDGLYPNGPVLEICCNNHRDFTIILQDGSLSSVWEEYEGLKKLSLSLYGEASPQTNKWLCALNYRLETI